MVKNIKQEGNDYIIKTVREIGFLIENMWQEYWELRLLKYDEKISKQIKDYIGVLTLKLSVMENSKSVVDDTQITDDFFVNIKKQFENYIREAENGLTK